MIAAISGLISAREGDTVVVQTQGGVGYAITLPLGVHERLPPVGERVSLFTELVVREDGWSLYGFDDPFERTVFQRLLSASGVGPKLALAVLSALGPARAARSIRDRDLAALASVTGIGKKKAERIVLELQDRFKELADAAPSAGPALAGSAAVAALAALGYSAANAEAAVRAELAAGTPDETAQLVRRALQRLAGK
ncbi:MAG TPA: Holliday junction branch migration protein RuvA [Gemmatimonadales bacterium]|nr:Holliday junction branch migration protein RuvA [Gemmatimonadales bacterium]